MTIEEKLLGKGLVHIDGNEFDIPKKHYGYWVYFVPGEMSEKPFINLCAENIRGSTVLDLSSKIVWRFPPRLSYGVDLHTMGLTTSLLLRFAAMDKADNFLSVGMFESVMRPYGWLMGKGGACFIGRLCDITPGNFWAKGPSTG